MEPSRDFREFFELLNANKVRYLLVGGHAFSVHAQPRYTKDLDIFFENSRNNAEKLLKTLKEFGFASLKIKVEDLIQNDRVIQLGYPPNRIDLLNTIEGVSFDNAWKGKISGKYDGEPIFIIGKKDLIANKKAAGREQDLLDVKQLEKN